MHLTCSSFISPTHQLSNTGLASPSMFTTDTVCWCQLPGFKANLLLPIEGGPIGRHVLGNSKIKAAVPMEAIWLDGALLQHLKEVVSSKQSPCRCQRDGHRCGLALTEPFLSCIAGAKSLCVPLGVGASMRALKRDEWSHRAKSPSWLKASIRAGHETKIWRLLPLSLLAAMPSCLL